MTEHFKAPEIIQLSSEQIANLSDAQFKTLVIKKLTELVEKTKAMLRETEENMKDMKNQMKKNVQGINSDRKETRTQINNLEEKEEIIIQPNRMN